MIIINNHLDYSVIPEHNQIHIFTANRYIRTDGALVQGRGAALDVKKLYPCVPFELGETISKCNEEGKNYYIAESRCSGHLIWAFQVKDSYNDNADINIIKGSVAALKELVLEMPRVEFHMNYPGIGNGHLEERDVSVLLEELPDNVLIYK